MAGAVFSTRAAHPEFDGDVGGADVGGRPRHGRRRVIDPNLHPVKVGRCHTLPEEAEGVTLRSPSHRVDQHHECDGESLRRMAAQAGNLTPRAQDRFG